MSNIENRPRPETKPIMSDNRTFTDVSEICELFNDCFASVSSRFHATIPPLSSEYDFFCHLHDFQVNTPFTFLSLKISEVESNILSLKVNKDVISTCLCESKKKSVF